MQVGPTRDPIRGKFPGSARHKNYKFGPDPPERFIGPNSPFLFLQSMARFRQKSMKSVSTLLNRGLHGSVPFQSQDLDRAGLSLFPGRLGHGLHSFRRVPIVSPDSGRGKLLFFFLTELRADYRPGSVKKVKVRSGPTQAV